MVLPVVERTSPDVETVSLWADAQALLGTTGLLHAPTADMQRDKTFLFGGNYLNTHPLSTHFRSSEV
eukprot:5948734-Prorocentrum_lima.AAC.1